MYEAMHGGIQEPPQCQSWSPAGWSKKHQKQLQGDGKNFDVVEASTILRTHSPCTNHGHVRDVWAVRFLVTHGSRNSCRQSSLERETRLHGKFYPPCCAQPTAGKLADGTVDLAFK